MTMSSAGLKTKYPWNDANRLQLVIVVKIVKGEGKSHSLKWREVARRMHNDSDLEEIMFGRLCAKQFDNLYRAYTKFRQDGDQPPRLTAAVIEEFDEIFPAAKCGVMKQSGGNGIGGSTVLDSKIVKPVDAMRGKSKGKKSHQLAWSNVTRINLLTAVRVSATKEGKIHWNEVAACMPNSFGISEERLCSLCMKQFTDLSHRYRDYKVSGTRPRRLSTEIIQNLDELYEKFPNLNPVPEGAQLAFLNGGKEHTPDGGVSSPAASEQDPDCRSSDRPGGPATSAPCSEPSSSSEDAHAPAPPEPAAPAPTPPPASTPPSTPAPDSNWRGDETAPASTANQGKRKDRNEASSSQTDMATQGDDKDEVYKDDQEVGFDRVERELLQLKSWLKQEVIPVGKEVLTRVKAYGRRNQTGKRTKSEPHGDFDKLICEASQKSTILFIRAQFQQARANILKEVKDTIERVGMDLLHRRANSFENGQAVLPGQPQEGAL